MALVFPKYRPSCPNPPRAPTTARRKVHPTVIISSLSRQRRSQNVEGDFFVDSRCIDCDTCRWMAPETFLRIDEKSAVGTQPSSKEERIKALQALLSCPTASIHTEKPTKEILEVQSTFPLVIDEQQLPGIYHCGFHSEKSYGAASYLIIHQDGNILVDSPRFSEILAKKMEMLGGVRYMFLTHKDDVADHEKWSKRFKCKRILHSQDVETSTVDVEMQLRGDGPWSIGRDFVLIHTPGHTQGSVCLYYKSLKVMFTGDHFAKNEESELSIFEMYNRDSVSKQLASVRKFLDVDFKWILPGHGRRVEFRHNKEKNSVVEAFLSQSTAEKVNMTSM